MHTTYQALRNWAEEKPDHVALLTPEEQYTYAELLEKVNALASTLRLQGVGKGDTVAMQLPNIPLAIMLYYATHAINAISLPILPTLRDRDISYILQRARPRVYVTLKNWRSIDFGKMAEQINLGDTRHIIVDASDTFSFLPHQTGSNSGYSRFDGQDSSETSLPASNLDDPATVIYTSGTSGRPKGVVYSHRSLFEEARSMATEDKLTQQDIVFVPASLGHIAGVAFMLHMTMYCGSTVCTLPSWNAEQAADLIRTARCSWMVGATPFLDSIMRVPWRDSDPLASLETYRCGGADVPPTLIEEARRRGIDAYRSYGMSEHPTISGRAGQDSSTSIHTDGLVHQGVDVRIVDPANHGVERHPNEEGEIVTRGPDRAIGYLGEDGNINRIAPEDWLATGDLGILFSDGSLRITGRKKDLIIRKGENISPKEIEDLLLEHSNIAQVAVVGVPDRDRGELVCCVAVARHSTILTLSDICTYLLGKGLPIFKQPEHLIQLEALPRNPNGKIDKKLLRELAKNNREEFTRTNY